MPAAASAREGRKGKNRSFAAWRRCVTSQPEGATANVLQPLTRYISHQLPGFFRRYRLCLHFGDGGRQQQREKKDPGQHTQRKVKALHERLFAHLLRIGCALGNGDLDHSRTRFQLGDDG